MKNKISLFILTLFLALTLVGLVNASQIADNTVLKVDDTIVNGHNVAIFAGNSIDLRISFTSLVDESDVKVKASIDGYKDDIEAETERFDVIAGKIYTKTLTLYLPSDMDATDSYQLLLRIASKDLSDETEYDLTLQRESYKLEILSVEYVKSVEAGDDLAVNVVVKNRGSHKIDDTFIRVKIPELGIEKNSYAGDLAPNDCDDNCSKEDTVEKNILITIPYGTKSGTYDLVVTAEDGDAKATETNSIEITGGQAAGTGIEVLTPQTLKDIQAGNVGEYTLTLLNTGNEARTVTITIGKKAGLVITANPSIVTIPANEAKDIKITVATDSTTQTGTYNVPLSIETDTNEPVQEFGITANVIKATGTKRVSVIAITIILLVILAVLIIALVATTRKPKEYSESGEELSSTPEEETAYY